MMERQRTESERNGTAAKGWSLVKARPPRGGSEVAHPSHCSQRRLSGSTELMLLRAVLPANCRGELTAVARMATPRAAHCRGWTSGWRAVRRDRQKVQPRQMLSLAHGLIFAWCDNRALASSGYVLFGNEGRDRFPFYPVDLRAKICAALPDFVGGRQMRRDDWSTTMNVLPPCLQAELDKGRRCVVKFKRQPHNVPHSLGC
jgi:hypothetical protein